MTGSLLVEDDLRGSIDLDHDMEPSARITIEGNIVDTGSNHVRIGRLMNGTYPDPGPVFTVGKQVANTVSGGNVNLRGGGQWFELGKVAAEPGIVNHYGRIKIFGTLSSPLIVQGEFRCQVEIGKIDGADDGGIPSGLLTDGNYGSESPGVFLGADITIGALTRGAIGFYSGITPQDPCLILGRIHISDGLATPGTGQTSTGDMGSNGRITCAYIDNREILIAADITIDGNMAGDIISTHSINDHEHVDSGSTITIAGNLESTARIEVVDVSGPVICGFGSTWATESEFGGTITIAGDATGDIITYGDLNALVDIGGDFGGHMECVDLNGDLFIGDDFNDAGPGDEIEISGVVASGVNIHVNHQLNIDGRWQNIATMKIGAAVHDNTWTAINNPSTTPDVWVVSEYRGDCSNDNAFDALDIEPFIHILFDRPRYLLEHPGLFSAGLTAEELMIYHGDSNCNGVVDAEDIEPFNNKLFDTPDSCTGCWCGLSPGQCCSPIGCNGPNCAMVIGGRPTFVARLGLLGGILHLALHELTGTVDKADRIAGMFLDHVDRRYFPRLIETCLELINRYQQAGDLERSDMWFRVLLALSAG